jgi:hypothetical protein
MNYSKGSQVYLMTYFLFSASCNNDEDYQVQDFVFYL